MKCKWAFIIFIFPFLAFSQSPSRVEVVNKLADKKVDVLVNGKLFTSYVYSDSLADKPVLYPVNTAQGDCIVKNLSKDAQVAGGLWLGYGNANGTNFWVNKNEIKNSGKIKHTKILKTKNGNDAGGLEVGMVWSKANGEEVLYQNNKYIFRAAGNTRTIDVVVTLTSILEPVIFTDSEEGFFALNLIKEISLPANGYNQVKNSERLEDVDIKGKKAKWLLFPGKIKNSPVSVAILDHPLNIGSPTFWDINYDGLVSANPLGLKIYSQGKQAANFEIPELNSAIFRYRVIIQSVAPLSEKQVVAEYEKFSHQQ